MYVAGRAIYVSGLEIYISGTEIQNITKNNYKLSTKMKKNLFYFKRKSLHSAIVISYH